MMSACNRQRGSTLLISLIMLVLLTLIAISAMNASTSSIQVVGNSQFRAEANAAAQQAIESVISNSAFQTVAPAAQNIDINGDGNDDYTVTFSPAPSCVSYVAVAPTDANVPTICFGSIGALCYWTVWDITAQVTDINGSGAATTVHQGIRTIAGLNAALAQCGV
jgi:type II secretory pathway pseudopilin PulG